MGIRIFLYVIDPEVASHALVGAQIVGNVVVKENAMQVWMAQANQGSIICVKGVGLDPIACRESWKGFIGRMQSPDLYFRKVTNC